MDGLPLEVLCRIYQYLLPNREQLMNEEEDADNVVSRLFAQLDTLAAVSNFFRDVGISRGLWSSLGLCLRPSNISLITEKIVTLLGTTDDDLKGEDTIVPLCQLCSLLRVGGICLCFEHQFLKTLFMPPANEEDVSMSLKRSQTRTFYRCILDLSPKIQHLKIVEIVNSTVEDSIISSLRSWILRMIRVLLHRNARSLRSLSLRLDISQPPSSLFLYSERGLFSLPKLRHLNLSSFDQMTIIRSPNIQSLSILPSSKSSSSSLSVLPLPYHLGSVVQRFLASCQKSLQRISSPADLKRGRPPSALYTFLSSDSRGGRRPPSQSPTISYSLRSSQSPTISYSLRSSQSPTISYSLRSSSTFEVYRRFRRKRRRTVASASPYGRSTPTILPNGESLSPSPLSRRQEPSSGKFSTKNNPPTPLFFSRLKQLECSAPFLSLLLFYKVEFPALVELEVGSGNHRAGPRARYFNRRIAEVLLRYSSQLQRFCLRRFSEDNSCTTSFYTDFIEEFTFHKSKLCESSSECSRMLLPKLVEMYIMVDSSSAEPRNNVDEPIIEFLQCLALPRIHTLALPSISIVLFLRYLQEMKRSSRGSGCTLITSSNSGNRDVQLVVLPSTLLNPNIILTLHQLYLSSLNALHGMSTFDALAALKKLLKTLKTLNALYVGNLGGSLSGLDIVRLLEEFGYTRTPLPSPRPFWGCHFNCCLYQRPLGFEKVDDSK